MTASSRRPWWHGIFKNLNAKIAAIPMIFATMVVFVGCSIWTIVYSFSKSRLLPSNEFVGFAQYERLLNNSLNPRWAESVENLAFYGIFSLTLSFVLGFVLAALIDQKVRFENVFRSIFLYPFALSFVVTGVVWQWLLSPGGIQEALNKFGAWSGIGFFEDLTFKLMASSDTVMIAILIAGLWQGTGFIMVLMLAGLRGIDGEIWKAARVDGIPAWKTYVVVIIPMMRGVFITTLVIAAAGIVKLYDLVVVMTAGGPGFGSEVPAKYVYDFMFARANLGQALAASTMMLVTVVIILIPWMYLEYGQRTKR